ncbi:MAG: STAS domain-containing protein [Candidatus Eiseniibacteriota bacterium]
MAPSNSFEYQLEQPDPDTLVYHLHGRLRGWPECFEFQEDLRRHFSGGAKRVVLDMGQIESIDSTGVGILTALYSTSKNAGGRLILAALTERARRILDVLWFLRALEHTETLEDAMTLLSSPAPPPES